MQEAQLAKTEMNGRLACGRPLAVRYASEKYLLDVKDPAKSVMGAKKPCLSGSGAGQMSRGSKIAAIKNKLKALEEEGCSAKKPKRTTDCGYSNHEGWTPIDGTNEDE